MLGIVQRIQLLFIALCIVSNIVYKRWVDILIVGDVDLGSAFDARGGGEVLVALERLAMWTLCCRIPSADSIGLARFLSTEAIDY